MKKYIAYLSSEYPGISHTFILREIEAIREEGFEVSTASINSVANLDKMIKVEKREAEATLYIKESSLIKLLKAHLSAFFCSPTGYISMLKETLCILRSGQIKAFKCLAYFIEAGVLIPWMHRKEISHLHVHFANPAATVAMIVDAYGKASFSISVHGPDIFYNVDKNLLAQKVKKALFVRCISHYCKSQLARLVPHEEWKKLHIVRCGIAPHIFHPRPDPDNNIPNLLCVGRLVPAKGQHVLLEACGRLKEEGISFSLTFVGGGEDQASLENLTGKLGMSDMVTFTGAVGQDDVRRYYDKADIFVLPSFAEGVPVVLMEAMSKEIASVSTRITGIPELIESGIDGLLVSPGDLDELSEILKGLLLDDDARRLIAAKGRIKVMDKYDISKNCKKMAELFRCFLDNDK